MNRNREWVDRRFDGPKPRERLLAYGPASLSDDDLLSILLNSGMKGKPVRAIARELLTLCGGNLDELGRFPPTAFATIEGIGMVKAVSLSAAMELGRRRHAYRTDSAHQDGFKQAIQCAQDVHLRFRERLADLGHEEFWMLALRRSNVVMSELMISKGGLSGTIADPKIIFGKALALRAAAIVVVHNHPSGNPRPSAADRRLTENLKRAGAVLDLPVLDHVIVAREQYFSFADDGAL